MHLLEARDIHETGLGADGDMLLIDILVIGPGGSHAAPVFELGTKGAVTIGKGRESPGQGQSILHKGFTVGNYYS